VSDGFFVADLDSAVAPGDRVVLAGAEAYHAAVVRRLTVGESVTVTNGTGLAVDGQVTSVAKTAVEIAVESVRSEPPRPLYLIVAQALPKTDRAELAVDLMTEAGVDQIVPWAASRSQVHWSGERGDKAHGKWMTAAREASKQARRSWFPVIEHCVSLADVAQLVADADCAIIMHERASRPVWECPVPAQGRVVIVIGPEGGLTDDEVAALESAGGSLWLMGPTVLRTSTAGAVAVTQVRLLAELQRGA
jgi:16S rRNA (uracil1498-N3)-methyltransferase